MEDKCIRELAVLIKLKSIYVSGCVHNYSPYKLSKESDLSRNTIKKYVNFYLELGYARMDGNNLVFNKFTKIEDKYKHATVNINPELSIKKISDLLHREILCDKYRKFNYIKKVKEDSSNPMGKDALKKLKKAKKAIRNLSNVNTSLPNASANYSVSIKKIAEHFNCSVGKAQGIVNSLCEDNLLKRTKNYIVIHKRTRSDKLHNQQIKGILENTKASFYSGGSIFQRKTNSYVF
jgi:cell division protein YceG involved in septum cleavage